jgi:hypothetical protein
MGEMTVQQLIDLLNCVEDKSKIVKICDDFFDERNVYVDLDINQYNGVVKLGRCED